MRQGYWQVRVIERLQLQQQKNALNPKYKKARTEMRELFDGAGEREPVSGIGQAAG